MAQQNKNIKKLYLDLDDTFVKTEDFIRDMLKQEGLAVPNNESIYFYRDKPVYNEIIEECFENYEAIPLTLGAESALNILKTEYEVELCSCFVSEGEKRSKIRLAERYNVPIKLLQGDFSKTSVDMSNAVLIDDSTDALRDSNAEIKLQMFNKHYAYGLSYADYLLGDHLIKSLSEAVEILVGGDLNDKCKDFRAIIYPRI